MLPEIRYEARCCDISSRTTGKVGQRILMAASRCSEPAPPAPDQFCSPSAKNISEAEVRATLIPPEWLASSERSDRWVAQDDFVVVHRQVLAADPRGFTGRDVTTISTGARLTTASQDDPDSIETRDWAVLCGKYQSSDTNQRGGLWRCPARLDAQQPTRRRRKPGRTDQWRVFLL